MTEKNAIGSSSGEKNADVPRFCTVGKPDIERFLRTFAALGGETFGLEVKTVGVRRKKPGERGKLFVLDGKERGQTA